MEVGVTIAKRLSLIQGIWGYKVFECACIGVSSAPRAWPPKKSLQLHHWS